MYQRTGLGATQGTVSQSPQVCVPFTSWSDPLCLYAAISGEYADSYEPQVTPVITQTYVKNAVPVPPAEAYNAGVAPGGGPDAESASDTIQKILSQSQLNAIAAAQQAAAAQAAANAPAKETACIADPSSIACWISEHSTMLILVGTGVAVLAVARFLK